MKRLFFGVAVLVALGMLFIGCQWQSEISVINILNGWDFNWVCCLWRMENWAAYDFFRGLMDTAVLLMIAISFILGYRLRDIQEVENHV